MNIKDYTLKIGYRVSGKRKEESVEYSLVKNGYEGEDIVARCFLHEIDHLDGHLYPEIAEKMLTAEELEEMLKQEEDAIEAEGEDE